MNQDEDLPVKHGYGLEETFGDGFFNISVLQVC